MELCLRTPDGAATVVEFSYDADVSDVAAAFGKLVSYPVHVGSIAAFQGCEGSERLSATGVADGDEVSVSHPTASERLARFPSDLHYRVAGSLYSYGWTRSDHDDRTLEHARCLAETGHPITAQFEGYSRPLTELGGPIWILGHETWLSDVVREHFLAQPEDFSPFEGSRDYNPVTYERTLQMGWAYHLPRAILEGNYFRRCRAGSFSDVRASVLAETAARWGDGHALCKVALFIPDNLSVISEATAAFADDVWTYRDAAVPAARYVHAGCASADALPETIPKRYCAMDDPSPLRGTLYLDVRAIPVAAKHGVSLEQMWQSLSEHMLRCADKKYPQGWPQTRETCLREKELDTRQWLAACWRLLALGLDPETRGARGVRGLHLCTHLRSRAGCLVFLAAGADRANVGTVGPCFDAGKECAGDCACHAYHSGVMRLRRLEAGTHPETQLNDIDTDVVCDCDLCDARSYQCSCNRCLFPTSPLVLPSDPDPWDEKDSRMERNGRMHTWRVRSNRSHAARK